jgi:hypothetical protein
MKVMRTAATLIGCAMIVSSVLVGVAAADNPHGTPPGQAKKDQAAASNSQAATADNSTGVKPSSTTEHNTTAAAGSNKTKQYGNGQTAGQIAMKNGASADTKLYGPGNSQPHKVAVCSKNGKSHQVDVHALKSHHGASCSSGSQAQTKENASAGAAPMSSAPATSSTGGVAGVQTSVTQSPAHARGGVLGVRISTGKPVTRRARPAHAVLGTANFTG